ncbi:hypothetical protein HPP92_011707, partial [Vanilla planifolia]
MDPHLHKKRPKLEENGTVEPSANERGMGEPMDNSIQEQEEVLIALIEHRTKEVEQLKLKASYYQSQAEAAEKRLQGSHSQLARLRCRPEAAVEGSGPGSVSPSSVPVNDVEAHPKPREQNHSSRSLVVIPSINPNKLSTTKAPLPVTGAGSKSASSSIATYKTEKSKPEVSPGPIHERRPAEPKEKRNKRKFVEKEHQDLIPSVCKSSLSHRLTFQPGTHLNSQHKRKLRSLELSPVDDQILVTTALDGVVNLWQVQVKGPSATLLSSTECLSPKQRRWPEDIAWHPDGDSLFAVYSADDGDCQISVLNLNLSGN